MTSNQSNDRPLVLYHGNCNDGFCAAYMAWLKFGGTADYIPVNYNQPPPDVVGRTVYILDFSYKRPVLLEIATVAKHITILDHHKTAEAELVDLGWSKVACVFDMNKSGGRLAQEYFWPDRISWLVDYTEDRDLWRFVLPHSKEVNAYIGIVDHKFESWKEIDKLSCPTYAMERGSSILDYQSRMVELQCRNARDIELAGYTVPSVNATMLISEIGNQLCKNKPFSATYFIQSTGTVVWSLRSDETGVDVSEIAKQFGGGGHKNAAGFTQPSLDIKRK